jgi:GT2 family glycosyltransferase
MIVFQFKEPARLDLSIIIVSFNTRDVLLDCLTSVYAKTEGISYEVILVDNASSDDTPDFVAEKFPDVHLIRNDVNKGFSAANNQGICESTGRRIALLNPDTRLIENSFQKICGYLQEHSEFSILGPGIIDEKSQQSPTRLWEDTPSDAAWKILGLYNPGDELQRMADTKEALVISGCCFVIHRELFEEVGLLDEKYFLYNEEDDFCRRARKRGKRICFFPETSIQHLLGKSTHQPEYRERVIVEAYKSNLYFYSKYYSCGWNLILRSLYKVTFMAGLVRSAFRHLTESASQGADDSLRLKLKLLFLP